jgi:hypothetical protein
MKDINFEELESIAKDLLKGKERNCRFTLQSIRI